LNILWKSHIFSFFSFIAFCQVFPRPFSLFWLSILLPFLFFNLVFYRPLFSPFFFALVLSLFFGPLVSTLAYPNLLGNKRLDCYCCCEYFMQGKYCMSADTQLNVFHASKLFVWLNYMKYPSTKKKYESWKTCNTWGSFHIYKFKYL
jgi:hypothetical protein